MKASYKLTGVCKVNMCQKKADPEKLRKSNLERMKNLKPRNIHQWQFIILSIIN
jgi:hypothetical protein